MTLDDVASDVGVAKSTILRYEKGTIAKIKLPVIQSIARSLTVNPNWLIGNTDDPSVLSPAPSELSPALSDEEDELIKAFRSLNPEGRLAALASIRGLAHEPPSETIVEPALIFAGGLLGLVLPRPVE